MAYGFNDDRSKVEVYTKTQIDQMDLANDQALAQEILDRQTAVSGEALTRANADTALGNRISNILDNQDLDPNKDSELVDIRTGYNGTVYPIATSRINSIENNLNSISETSPLQFLPGWIDTSGETVDVTQIIDDNHSLWLHAITDASPGDAFLVNVEYSISARACCFIDEDGNVLRATGTPPEGTSGIYNGSICAPPSTAKAIFNARTSSEYMVIVGKSAQDRIDEISYDMYSRFHSLSPLMAYKGYYYPIGSNSSVDINTATPNNIMACFLSECEEGDEFVWMGKAAITGRQYAFLDSNGVVLERAGHWFYEYESHIPVTLRAPENSAYFIANAYIEDKYLVAKKLDHKFDIAEAHLNVDEVEHGRIDTNTGNPVNDSSAIRFVRVKDFLPSSVKGIYVLDEDHQIAIGQWNKDGSWAGHRSWVQAADSRYFEFDNDQYDYKLWIRNVNGNNLYDIQGCVDSFVLLESVSDVVSNYHDFLANAIDSRDKSLYSIAERIMHSTPYNINYANAINPLRIKSYLGDYDAVHPKVLYFRNGLFGHKFWMAYTTYPYNIDMLENPCITYSDDGYEWIGIENNPIYDPHSSGNRNTSDTHLLYRTDTGELECWYRYTDRTVSPSVEYLYRQKSTDGLNWSEKEQMFINETGNAAKLMSPAVYYDGSKYCVWVVDDQIRKIVYYEGTTANAFTKIREIDLSYIDDSNVTYYPWHIDVINENGHFIALIMCKSVSGNTWTLFISESDDNINFTTPTVVIYGQPNSWDAKIYRSTLVNVDGEYRIYYSSNVGGGMNRIGLTKSNKLSEFIGYQIGY